MAGGAVGREQPGHAGRGGGGVKKRRRGTGACGRQTLKMRRLGEKMPSSWLGGVTPCCVARKYCICVTSALMPRPASGRTCAHTRASWKGCDEVKMAEGRPGRPSLCLSMVPGGRMHRVVSESRDEATSPSFRELWAAVPATGLCLRRLLGFAIVCCGEGVSQRELLAGFRWRLAR